MTSYPFALVDVFAEQVFSGNPLAVVGDADGLTVADMRRAAVEFRQSETTFVLTATHPSAHCRLRSFTPSGEEVTGVGHNVLGAWWWLAATRRLDLAEGITELSQEIGGQVLPVLIESHDGRPELVTLHQPPAEFGRDVADVSMLARALGLSPDELARGAQVVSTGASHLLVELRSRGALDTVSPDSELLRRALAEVGGQGCYVWVGSDRRDLVDARFFNPTVGIHEDAATGSAAGPLAALLVHRDPSLHGRPITVDQGAAMGRPSRLRLVVEADGVRLHGSCVISVSGVMHHPDGGRYLDDSTAT